MCLPEVFEKLRVAASRNSRANAFLDVLFARVPGKHLFQGDVDVEKKNNCARQVLDEIVQEAFAK